MELIKRVVNPFRWFKRTGDKKCVVLSPEERLSLTLKPYQSYLYKLQELLMWKNPRNSIVFVAVINVMFLVIYITEWRFYGALFSLLCALTIYECWTQYVWPEIRVENTENPSENPQTCEGMLSIPEVCRAATLVKTTTAEVCHRASTFRQKHPTLFCSVGCTFCAIMARIGCIVPGIVLVYTIVMIMLLSPGIVIHCVSPEIKQSLCSVISRITSLVRPPDTAPGIDEYLPDTSKENLKLLNLASGAMPQTSGNQFNTSYVL